MLVFACIGLDTRVIIPKEKINDPELSKLYNGFVCDKQESDDEFYFIYPLYSSKSNIPERLKKTCKIKAIKTFDRELYAAIEGREYAIKLAKEFLGLNLDDPFDCDPFHCL